MREGGAEGSGSMFQSARVRGFQANENRCLKEFGPGVLGGKDAFYRRLHSLHLPCNYSLISWLWKFTTALLCLSTMGGCVHSHLHTLTVPVCIKNQCIPWDGCVTISFSSSSFVDGKRSSDFCNQDPVRRGRREEVIFFISTWKMKTIE